MIPAANAPRDGPAPGHQPRAASPDEAPPDLAPQDSDAESEGQYFVAPQGTHHTRAYALLSPQRKSGMHRSSLDSKLIHFQSTSETKNCSQLMLAADAALVIASILPAVLFLQGRAHSLTRWLAPFGPGPDLNLLP